MHTLTRIFSSKLLLIAIAITGLAGCQIESEPKSDLEQIRERGVLRVGTLNNQLSYYIGPDGPAGLDYELAREFAEQLGVQLEMKPAYRLSGLFPALQKVKSTLSQRDSLRTMSTPAAIVLRQHTITLANRWCTRKANGVLVTLNN